MTSCLSALDPTEAAERTMLNSRVEIVSFMLNPHFVDYWGEFFVSGVLLRSRRELELVAFGVQISRSIQFRTSFDLTRVSHEWKLFTYVL